MQFQTASEVKESKSVQRAKIRQQLRNSISFEPRMANEKHWLTDVATGAGIGILSTKIAYWIHPLIKKTIFKDIAKTSGVVMPFYNGRAYGLGLSMTF